MSDDPETVDGPDDPETVDGPDDPWLGALTLSDGRFPEGKLRE